MDSSPEYTDIIGPPTSPPPKQKKKKRRRKKGKKQGPTPQDSSPEYTDIIGPPTSPPSKQKKKNRRRKKGKKQGQGEDRYFGRFHCKLCGKMWESSHVYTIAGTRKVKYKQRCKNCTEAEAWCFPYDLDMIRCSFCDEPATNCICRCEDCQKLWYRPRGRTNLNENDYCCCDRRNQKNHALGDKIDPKKPHHSKLCGKCQTGQPCLGRSEWEE